MARILTLHHPDQALVHYQAKVWQSDTMYQLARRHAVERGRSFSLRDAHRRLTWSQVVSWVDALAQDLETAGLRSGDRVSVWLPNRLEATVAFLACSRNGYICNPSLHQNYTVEEIKVLLNSIGARALITQPGWGADSTRASIFAAAADIPSLKRVYALPSLNSGAAPLPSDATEFPALPSVGVGPTDFSTPSSDPDQIVYLAFTSGTTGRPKAVMHSDNTLLANGRTMVADWGHGSDTVLLSLSPMSHHIGTVALEQALVAGCELVVLDPSAGIVAIDWIHDTGATYVMGVPTHAMDLLHVAEQQGLTQLGSVRVFYLAGSPIPSETARKLMALGAKPQNVYGMTENGSHQYTKPTDSPEVITSTCGKACKGYEIKLWNQENPDIEATPGEIGEIGGRGGLLMLGYFGNQLATESSFNSSGWFMSGDLGKFDENGNLQIVGRKKDLIIRGGHNIHPARVEDLAHRHPRVKKAAAFAVADERLGEKVCLAIIADGQAPTGDELLNHLAEVGLSKFDMPEYYIALDSMPLTASGKILKRELVEWARIGKLQPQPVRYQGKSQ
jgi:acyl-CoA synthetase